MLTKPSELTASRLIGAGKVPVSADLFNHMMDVLPPRDMGGNWFVFQEGDGDALMFSRSSRGYTVELKSALLSSEGFGAVARIRWHPAGGYRVISAFRGQDGADLIDLVGERFETLEELAEKSGYRFG